MAQEALSDAEERLVKRLDEDMKATEEFNAMELELKKLLKEKATMVRAPISHTEYLVCGISCN